MGFITGSIADNVYGLKPNTAGLIAYAELMEKRSIGTASYSAAGGLRRIYACVARSMARNLR